MNVGQFLGPNERLFDGEARVEVRRFELQKYELFSWDVRDQEKAILPVLPVHHESFTPFLRLAAITSTTPEEDSPHVWTKADTNCRSDRLQRRERYVDSSRG